MSEPIFRTEWTDADGTEHRFSVFQDDDAMSPAEWDQLGTLVTWHRNYAIGHEQPSAEPIDWLEQLKEDEPEATILPVYAYEHGGITISTGEFSCPWDSGQIGYIYTTPARIKEMGFRLIQVDQALRCEVEAWDQYLTGQVYGFQLETREASPCGSCDRPHEWEHEDSCWGFYGDWKESGMLEHLDSEVAERVKVAA